MNRAILTLTAAILASTVTQAHGDKKEINVSVTEKGFDPKVIHAKPGEHVVLNITRKTESTCAKQVQVPAVMKDKKIDLPLNKVVAVDLGELKKGEIKFGCGMGMMEAAQVHVN